MTRGRWIITVLMLAMLAALVGWSRHRERMMEACLGEGGTWNGVASRCEAPRIGPILRRALERT